MLSRKFVIPVDNLNSLLKNGIIDSVLIEPQFSLLVFILPFVKLLGNSRVQEFRACHILSSPLVFFLPFGNLLISLSKSWSVAYFRKAHWV